jgi:hypothetical protein
MQNLDFFQKGMKVKVGILGVGEGHKEGRVEQERVMGVNMIKIGCVCV